VTRIRVTHVGGPTVVIETQGWRILTDPTFDPPGRTYKFGWGSKSTKLSGPALAPDDLGPIDAILLSHDHHADNLDDAGRALLAAAPIVITTKSAARRFGSGVRGLNRWDVTRLEAEGKLTIDVMPPGRSLQHRSCPGTIDSCNFVGTVATKPGRNARTTSTGHGRRTSHLRVPKERRARTTAPNAGTSGCATHAELTGMSIASRWH
jgi:L-ascorbate metabolism protein UlaG (beta-lactamase superfamily)